MRLLLDSGSQYVVLTPRAAARSGCSGGHDLPLVGAGASTAQNAKLLCARTVEIDSFVAHDVNVLVANDHFADGIDGVVPFVLFRPYLVRLNVPAKSLDLQPYPDQTPARAEETAAVESNDLLFVKCRLNRSRDAFFLLDTGASYNAVSLKLAKELASPDLMDRAVPLRGGTAAMEAPATGVLTRMQMGSLELVPNPMVVVDLSLLSRYHQMEIAGLIGFPALRDATLVVNYRDRMVRIDRGKSAKHGEDPAN